MANGDRVPVKKREWAMVTPHGDTLIVFTGKKLGGDYEMKLLHVPWVEEIKPQRRVGNGARRNGHK
jgi:hypothetical protein